MQRRRSAQPNKKYIYIHIRKKKNKKRLTFGLAAAAAKSHRIIPDPNSHPCSDLRIWVPTACMIMCQLEHTDLLCQMDHDQLAPNVFPCSSSTLGFFFPTFLLVTPQFCRFLGHLDGSISFYFCRHKLAAYLLI